MKWRAVKVRQGHLNHAGGAYTVLARMFATVGFLRPGAQGPQGVKSHENHGIVEQDYLQITHIPNFLVDLGLHELSVGERRAKDHFR